MDGKNVPRDPSIVVTNVSVIEAAKKMDPLASIKPSSGVYMSVRWSTKDTGRVFVIERSVTPSGSGSSLNTTLSFKEECDVGSSCYIA